jgi:hypothetical protein
MTAGIRFANYKSVPQDELSVEWLEVKPTDEAHYETVRAAGFEPEDSAVKVGALRRPWGVHAAGCLVVCYGSLSISRRVAVSESPAAFESA